MFHVPVVLDKFRRQPVKQLGVRRRFALSPEVVQSRGQAGAKKQLPHPVDIGARRQRVFGVHDPLGQVQPVRPGIVLAQLGFRQERRHGWQHFLAGVIQPVTAWQNAGHARLLRLGDEHGLDRFLDVGKSFARLVDPLAQLGRRRGHAEVMAQQGRPLGGGALGQGLLDRLDHVARQLGILFFLKLGQCLCFPLGLPLGKRRKISRLGQGLLPGHVFQRQCVHHRHTVGSALGIPRNQHDLYRVTGGLNFHRINQTLLVECAGAGVDQQVVHCRPTVDVHREIAVMPAALWLANDKLQLVTTARLGFKAHRHRAVGPTVRAQQFFQALLRMIPRVAGARF